MKIALCLVHKDENQYLNDWLDWHRYIGVDHFYIYDNESAIHPSNSISNLDDVTITNWPGDYFGLMTSAYQHVMNTVPKDIDYIGFIDTDEFIVLLHGYTLRELLAAMELRGGQALGLHWLCYGTSWYEVPRTNPFSYHLHATPNDPYGKWMKSIVKTGLTYKLPDTHYFSVTTLNTDGDVIYGANTNSPVYDKAFVRHNITRSRQEFMTKVKRGGGERGPEATKWHGVNIEEFINRFNKE
jgi:hypothetical protein